MNLNHLFTGSWSLHPSQVRCVAKRGVNKRFYSAVNKKGFKVLPSGAAYEVQADGSWKAGTGRRESNAIHTRLCN